MFRLLVQVALVDAADIWSPSYYTHCYAGHGGVPLDADDTPIGNTTLQECQDACEVNEKCHAFTHQVSRRRKAPSDCFLRSSVNLQDCDSGYNVANWATFSQVAPPSKTNIIAYHLFEGKYTGLANKDAGDFKGDAGFIFGTFSKYSAGNPEASMEHNVIEMTEFNVTGWGKYEECNAPGADQGSFNCSSTATDYCCTTHDPNDRHHNIPANHTKDQLPGLEVNKMSLGSSFGFPGFWFSFPKESEGTTWTQRVVRRIAGKCLGDAWRKDAGGCSQCGDSLDQCVASCIKGALCQDGSTEQLEATWDRVFADPSECPEIPFPQESQIVV